MSVLALVILMTAFSSVDSAVEGMQLGAYSYVDKSFNLHEVAVMVEKALGTSRLRRELRTRRGSAGLAGLDAIIGASDTGGTPPRHQPRPGALPHRENSPAAAARGANDPVN